MYVDFRGRLDLVGTLTVRNIDGDVPAIAPVKVKKLNVGVYALGMR